MIDIDELRTSVEAAEPLLLMARKDVLELLDRLEAAETDALEQASVNGMGSEREASLMAKLESAKKERDKLISIIVDKFGDG